METQIAVVFGGPSPEHDISILTGLQCERILRRHSGVKVDSIYWDRHGNWFLVPENTEARDYIDGPPAKATAVDFTVGRPGGWIPKKGMRRHLIPTDAILNCMHGGLGEGGGAQALFALAGLPATGGTTFAASAGMDKFAFATMVASAGVATLPRELLTESSQHSLTGPIIVKPRFGGSSIGIEIADSIDTARALLRNSIHLRQGAVIEPYREDLYDLNLSYRTYPEFELSAVERPIRQGTGTIYSFEEKYLNESGLSGAKRELPANLPDGLRDKMAHYAKLVAEATGLTGIVRIDFLSNGDELYVNEVNSIPGAMALYLWLDHPVDRMLLDAIDEARSDYTDPVVAQSGSSAGALQVASGISSKLAGLTTES